VLSGSDNHAGALGLESVYGVELTYARGPASVNAGFQQTSASALNDSSVNGAKVNFPHMSGTYQITPSMRLLAGWLHGQHKPGTIDLSMQQAGAPPLRGRSPASIDDSFYVGATSGPPSHCWTQWTAPVVTHAMHYSTARYPRYQLPGHRACRALSVETHQSVRNRRLCVVAAARLPPITQAASRRRGQTAMAISASESGESENRPTSQASQNAQQVYVNAIIAYDTFGGNKAHSTRRL